jgi:colanic acid biosynthesis glycosyl transferase WcaI
MGLLKGKWLRRIIMRMERTVLRRFDRVTTISRRMVARLLTKGVTPERTHYFPNWVDLSRFTASSANCRYRAELNIAPRDIVVLFSGTLGDKHGLLVIPSTARLLAYRDDIVFVVCGDGIMKSALESACSNLPNMRLLSLQPAARLGELLGMADIHLLPQSPDVEDLVLPSKLSGMLASGRPVIATCRTGTELGDVVAECGLVVAPQDSAALALAICKLAEQPEKRGELGRRARAFAESHYDRDSVLRRIFWPLEGEERDIAHDSVT